MAIIGITGKSGSGKSTLGRFFEDLGYRYLELDDFGHRVIEECSDILVEKFGISNRKQLGDIIFNDREKYKEMVELIWKKQMKLIDNELKFYKDYVLDFILLPHTKYWNMCDKKILCKCPYEIRKKRVLMRDNITEEYFKLRENASIEYNEDEMDLIIQPNYSLPRSLCLNF